MSYTFALFIRMAPVRFDSLSVLCTDIQADKSHRFRYYRSQLCQRSEIPTKKQILN